jgi:hypothetical protein
MSRRKWIILGASLLLLTVGIELTVRPWDSHKGCVQIQNDGNTPIDDLIVSYADTSVTVGTVSAGQSVNVWFTAAGKGTLTLEFKQEGNPLKGFAVEDFDPDDNARNGVKLALIVKNNEVVRFMEDDQSQSPFWNLVQTVKDWFLTDTTLR